MPALIDRLGDARDHFLIAIILVFGITLVIFKNEGALNNLRRTTLTTFSYLEQPLSRIQVYRKALQTNEELRRQNIELLDEVSRLRSARFENEQLRSLLGFRDSSSYQLTPVMVTGKELTGINNFMTINAGLNENLAVGMPLVNSQGFIGRIILTSRNHSLIMPYIDIRSRISAKIQGLETGGIVSWDGQRMDELLMSNFPIDVNVDSGAVVETSGLSNELPANIPIGIIIRSKPEPGKDTKTLYLRPMVNLFDISEGFIIKFKADTALMRLRSTYQETFQ